VQLAGYLHGRALQEWNLLSSDDKQSFADAFQALRSRLDTGSHVLAAQDFRYSLQRDSDAVSDYIRRLDRAFQVAYGHEKLTVEMQDAPQYNQLHV